MVEEWGGDTLAIPTSARENKGINELLEAVLLIAELEDLRADPNQPASGVVIEAEMDKTKGPMATVLVQSGTLNWVILWLPAILGGGSKLCLTMWANASKRLNLPLR